MSKKHVPNAVSLWSISSGSRRRNAARPSVRNLKLEIEYDGTKYRGWQIQSRRDSRSARRTPKSIQETIEKALQKILQEKIRLIASGRTDAGVHAQAQVANFKTRKNIPLEKLQKALNANLPDDIVITKIEEGSLGFHSRFDARTKIYRYTILNRPYRSVHLRNRVYFYPYPLSVKLMQEESRVLLGRHDFKAFCASGSTVKNTVRVIKKISIGKLTPDSQLQTSSSKDVNLIAIDIEADGFLYNMARNIAGTLIEIGRGKFSKGSLKKILISRNRKAAGPTAPACGLCLMKVKY